MVVCITGKPRGGKSYYSVAEGILPELLSRDADGRFNGRVIITNVPLNWEHVIRFIERHCPQYFLERELADWLHVWPLEREWDYMPEFWRWRHRIGDDWDAVHPTINKEAYKSGVRPDWHLNTQPVFYVLDELHKFFNARQWSSNGLVTLDYLSQHGHFGDNVWWITQSVANVDRQFRSVTQEFRLCRNLSKERFGKFSRGDGFKLYVFSSEAGIFSV